MSVFWLQVTEPGHPSRVVPIDSRLEVGRDCDGLQLDDPTVSRRHLWLEPAPDGLILVDMGSANGTFVDDAKVEQPLALQAGNVIRLGESLLVVHEGHQTSASAEGSGVVIDPHERPSEVLRDLKSASARNFVGKDKP
jgi:pSer/pThr/pTyr-binding forkhead associated (FHA) protein